MIIRCIHTCNLLYYSVDSKSIISVDVIARVYKRSVQLLYMVNMALAKGDYILRKPQCKGLQLQASRVTSSNSAVRGLFMYKRTVNIHVAGNVNTTLTINCSEDRAGVQGLSANLAASSFACCPGCVYRCMN